MPVGNGGATFAAGAATSPWLCLRQAATSTAMAPKSLRHSRVVLPSSGPTEFVKRYSLPGWGSGACSPSWVNVWSATRRPPSPPSQPPAQVRL